MSDGMLSAAATAIGFAGSVADLVALSVARRAVAEGSAPPLDDHQIVHAVRAHEWVPVYMTEPARTARSTRR